MHIESIGSVRGFRARFASQLVQFGASERVTHTHTHTHTHTTHTHTLTTVHSVSHKARSRRLEGKLHNQPPTAEKRTPSSLYTQNTSHLPNSAFHNIESIGSVRGFRERFASQSVQFGASERVSRVNWGLQSAFRDSIGSVRGFRARFASQLVQLGASERVTDTHTHARPDLSSYIVDPGTTS